MGVSFRVFSRFLCVIALTPQTKKQKWSFATCPICLFQLINRGLWKWLLGACVTTEANSKPYLGQESIYYLPPDVSTLQRIYTNASSLWVSPGNLHLSVLKMVECPLSQLQSHWHVAMGTCCERTKGVITVYAEHGVAGYFLLMTQLRLHIVDCKPEN